MENLTRNDACCTLGKHFMKFAVDKIEIFGVPLICFIFLEVTVALLAVTGNSVIIIAILKSPILHKPSYLLIIFMAFIDLMIGLVEHPFTIIRITFVLQKSVHHICYTRKTANRIGFFLRGMCFTMTLLISIDRYLALTLRHRYRVVVRKRRVLGVVFVDSILVLVFTLCVIQCETAFLHWRVIGAVSGLAALTATVLFYMKSFRALHLYTSKVRAPNNLEVLFDVLKYKKSLNTMVLILAWMLVCYIPMICAGFITYTNSETIYSVFLLQGTGILFSINSFTNPIIYVLRFSDIREATRKLLENCRC